MDVSWKIVLIDDEKDIREVMAITLEDSGFEVFTAADGEAGLKLCREKKPQIVITDIRMPKMNGIQVLESLKTHSPSIEVIVATAYGELELAVQALQLDASDFIIKPINDVELNLALDRARDRYTSRQRLKEYASLLEKENAETHQELVDNIAFQRKLIDGSMDGILASDENDLIVTFNKALERMTGYSKLEVLHKKSIADFFSSDEEKRIRADLASDEYGGKERLFLYETGLLNRNGQSVPVQTSVSELHSDRYEGLVFIFRDLRNIRKLEREMADQARILHQDKMMSLGRLAASTAHEINNPLSGILNYIRLMIRIMERGPLADADLDKFSKYLDVAEKETDRCTRIVSSLLTFSRKSPPAFTDVALDELINKCIVLSRHKMRMEKIEFHLEYRPDIPIIKGDMNQLQQCVINIIFNAVDAMVDGGRLDISTWFEPLDKKVIIKIADTGSGISEDNMPRIFEPFFTTKSEGYGVGLGLSTTYGIIERHGGAIEVESREGHGSVFTISLPVPEQA